jgi:hypothetical protein
MGCQTETNQLKSLLNQDQTAAKFHLVFIEH